ncbi:MAG TPA: ATP-binding protein [Kofleriaceae bacterium]|nr:ATP-binding protein [Kofleriaceae bacterium]
MKILLVEDNLADARLFAELLAEVPGRPFQLTSVASFSSALAEVGGHDIVFLDLSLPDAHGIDTVTRMVEAARELPIVVLTGTDDDRVATEAMKLGAQDYLLKAEITPSQIARSARYAIERKHAEHHAKRAHQADEAARRARFLSSISGTITSSLELATTLPDVARLLLPMLGDACAIDLLREDARVDRVARAGEAERLERIAMLGSRVIEERAPLAVNEPGGESVLCLPLMGRGRVVGALTFVMAAPRMFDEELRRLADEAAERIAMGIDNASLYEAAQRAIRGRDELLAVVSHDLRNPLNVVALALQSVAHDPMTVASALPRALRGVDRMQRLIEDLLDVARIDTGTLGLELRPVNVTALVDEVVEQHRQLAAEKKISLKGETMSEHIGARADRHRLLQVLANLLSNAFKFTPPGGTIKLGVEVRGERVGISVSDTGPGIPAEHLGHIFDRFWQPERRRDGVGLGLAIVKGIVDAHGGTIEVDSKPGIGTTFRVFLDGAVLRPTGVVAVVA